MECEKCGFSDDSSDATFYSRNCRVCGALVQKGYELPLVSTNALKLKLLQAKVREKIKKTLFKGDGEKNANCR